MNQFDSRAIKPEVFQYIDDYTDNFALIQDVVSERLYGDPSVADAPWVSVVIPTFGRERFFQEALNSVLSQEPVNYCWELLVVDNTPLDEQNTTPALQKIRQINNPGILYYHNQTNLGSGYNWNRGVELSRGQWICFLHDDDVLCSDALKNIGKQLTSFQGMRPLGYLHARRIEFSERFEAPPPKCFLPERLTRFGVLLSGCTGAGAPSCGTVILKEAYLSAGGINYNYGLSADAVLCYQIMKNYAVVCSDRVLGGYRWDSNETLKLDSLLQMIQADELLSAFSYQQSRFAGWWGNVFGAASSWRNIRRKQKIAERHKIQATKEDFCGATQYAEPTKLKKAVFLGIYALYRLWRMAAGWLTQLLSKLI